MATGTADLNTTAVSTEERFIEQQLDKTRRQVKLVDLLGVLMILGIGVLVFLLLVAIVDAWLFDLGRWGRLLALLTISFGGLAYLVAYVAPLLFRKVNPVYAARTIEQAEPSLKNGLINFLLFRSAPKDLEKPVYQALEHQAAVGLSRVPIETAVDRSKLIRLGGICAGVLVVCAVYSVASPKSPFKTLRRVAAPLADIDRPTRVNIDQLLWKRQVTDKDVDNWRGNDAFQQLRRGDWLVRFENDEDKLNSPDWKELTARQIEIFHGTKIGVVARVQGIGGDDSVKLFYSTADGNTVDQAAELRPDGSLYSHVLSPSLSGIQQDLSFYLAAGDARTREIDVRVRTAPTITVESLQYDYPTYSGRPPQKIEGQGDVKALEGTKVTVTAVANLPIKDARIELGSAGDSQSTTAKMSVKGQEAVGEFFLELRADRKTPAFSEYTVHFTTGDGYENENAAEYPIEVIPDLAPDIEILTPRRERIEVPANRSQTIEVRALDPDFALRRISLRAASAGTDLLNTVLLDAASEAAPKIADGRDTFKHHGHVGQAVVTYEFRPEALKLKPGDEVVYWAVAEDNRTSVRHQFPEPNVSRTPNFYLKIAPPETTRGAGTSSNDPKEEEDKNDSKEEAGEEGGSDAGAGSDSQSTGSGGGEEGEAGEAESGDASGGSPSDSDSSNADASEGSNGGGQGTSSPSEGNPSGDTESSGSESAQQGNSDSTSQAPSNSTNQTETPAPNDGNANGHEIDGSNTGEGVGKGEASGKPDLDNASVKRSGDSQPQESESNEPLHEGEVFEKILDHLKNKQDNASDEGEPSGNQNNDASNGQPENGDGSKSDQLAGRGPKNGGQMDDKGPGNGSTNEEDKGDTGNSGDPQGPAETRQENPNNQTGSEEPDANSQGETGDAGAGQESDGERGSPKSQGENRDRGKSAQPDEGGVKKDDEAESPSTSNKQSDSQGENAGDRSGGGGKGGGQDANQAGKDTAGSNTSADSGAGASSETGAGDTSGQGGDDQTAADKTGTSGEQSGGGSGNRDDPAGDQLAKRPGEQPGDPAGNPYGGSGGIADSPSGNGLGDAEIPPGEEAKLEYAEKATDLALDYLRDQDAAADRELLDKLGWTEEEMQSFVERWSQLKRRAIDGSGEDRGELTRSLRSLGLRPDGDKRRAASDQNDQFRDLRDDGFRETIPSKYAEQFNAFQRGAARVEDSR